MSECSPGHCINGLCHTLSAGTDVTRSRIDVRCTIVTLQWQQVTCRTIDVNVHQAFLSECHGLIDNSTCNKCQRHCNATFKYN